ELAEHETDDGSPDVLLVRPDEVRDLLGRKRSPARKMIALAVRERMHEIAALMERADHSCAFVVDSKKRQRRNPDGSPQMEGVDTCIACQQSSAIKGAPSDQPHVAISLDFGDIKDPEVAQAARAALQAANEAQIAQRAMAAHPASVSEYRREREGRMTQALNERDARHAAEDEAVRARDAFNDAEAARFERKINMEQGEAMKTQQEALDAMKLELKVMRDEEDARTSAYPAQVDWQAFVVEHDGVRGISLRKLVDAGLYSQYSHAVRALNSSGFDVTEAKDKSSGGRPPTEHIITNLNDAQRFCVRAHTAVGDQIADLIIAHHGEFQALLNGDARAHAKIAAAAPAPQIDHIEA